MKKYFTKTGYFCYNLQMSIQEDIDMLDSKLANLKITYEQYFANVIKREPIKERQEVDRIVIRYSNTPINNTMLKFRFRNLVSKYNTYKQYWNRVLRLIEEGKYERKSEGGGMGAPSPPKTQAPSSASKKTTAEGDGSGLKDVYEEYIAAREQCNEPTKGLSFDNMKKSLEAQKQKLAESKGVKDVDLKVYIKDGKAKIAIAPKKNSA